MIYHTATQTERVPVITASYIQFHPARYLLDPLVPLGSDCIVNKNHKNEIQNQS